MTSSVKKGEETKVGNGSDFDPSPLMAFNRPQGLAACIAHLADNFDTNTKMVLANKFYDTKEERVELDHADPSPFKFVGLDCADAGRECVNL